MKRLLVKEFISIYQYAIFCQVRAIYGSLVPDEDFGETTISFNSSILRSPDDTLFFPFLLNNTNIGNVVQVLGDFKFLPQILKEDKFIFFALDNSYNFYFGIETSTGKIILFDDDQRSYTYIAKDELHFLNYLKTHLEYAIISTNIAKLQLLKDWVREQVILNVGGEEYEKYYTFLFPKEEELNERRILELPYRVS